MWMAKGILKIVSLDFGNFGKIKGIKLLKAVDLTRLTINDTDSHLSVASRC